MQSQPQPQSPAQQNSLSNALLNHEAQSSSHTDNAFVSLYRTVYPGKLPLRSGIELSSDTVYTVTKGTLLEVIQETAVLNEENIKRVRVVAIDNIQCKSECWVSFKTRDGRPVIVVEERVDGKGLGRNSAHPLDTSSSGDKDDTTDLLKKILTQSDLLVMFGNTIISVFTISAAVSLVPRDDATISYTFCDYGENGEADTVLVQCPYLPSPAFISVICIWMLYFCVTFLYKFMLTSQFHSSDLRFYMACDKHNTRIVHRILIGIGVFLTVVSGLFGVSFIVSNGNDAAVGGILVFMTLNIYNLYGMTGCIYKPLTTTSITHKFPNPIYVKGVPLLSHLSHKAVFDYIHQSALEHCLSEHVELTPLSGKCGNDDKVRYSLTQIGDPDQLLTTLTVLNISNNR